MKSVTGKTADVVAREGRAAQVAENAEAAAAGDNRY